MAKRMAMRSALRRWPAVVLLAAALPVAPASGWGAAGHRIVGLVADQLLDQRSRTALRGLAGNASLAEIGLWMDQHRGQLRATEPGSERWHFDNRPVCSSELPLDAYCADGNCAARAYARYLALLHDRRAPAESRLFALRVVVHVLADVHQPLHAADHADRGANQVRVQVGRRGRTSSLHAAWDVDFVRRAVAGETEAEFAARLVADHRAERTEIEAGTFADWQQESYQLARDFAYGRLPDFACGSASRAAVRLPQAYADGATGIVSEQLARAGIRLAAVLRATL